MIGGNVSTQAGGTFYYNHGSIRNHVLGLEVVLADGTVLDMMSTISKDNTGLDLKQNFICSEGTLGVVTKINMVCPRRDKERKVMFLRVDGFNSLYKLNTAAKSIFGKNLTAIEYQDYESYAVIGRWMGESIKLPIPVNSCKATDKFMMIQISGNNHEALEDMVATFFE